MRIGQASIAILVVITLSASAGCSNTSSGEPIEVDPITLEPLPTIEEKKFNYFACVEGLEIALKSTLAYQRDSDPNKDERVNLGAKKNCIHNLD